MSEISRAVFSSRSFAWKFESYLQVFNPLCVYSCVWREKAAGVRVLPVSVLLSRQLTEQTVFTPLHILLPRSVLTDHVGAGLLLGSPFYSIDLRVWFCFVFLKILFIHF